MKNMKEGDKRIRNDDFEQVVECYECHALFWATSEYELGNWQNSCNKCRKIREKKQEEKEKNIKENGETIKVGEKIVGWELGEDVVYNYGFTTDIKPRGGIGPFNIDDKIRELKKKGKRKITWHPDLYLFLLEFILANGFHSKLKPPFTYMQVKHYLGEEGNYNYLLK